MKKEININNKGEKTYRIGPFNRKIGDEIFYYDKEIIKIVIDNDFEKIYNNENIIYFSLREDTLKKTIADKIYGIKHINNIPEVGERVSIIEKFGTDDEIWLTFESGMSVRIRTYNQSYSIKPYKIELDIEKDNRGRYYDYVDNHRDEIKPDWEERFLNDEKFIEKAGKIYMAKLRKDKISKLNDEENDLS